MERFGSDTEGDEPETPLLQREDRPQRGEDIETTANFASGNSSVESFWATKRH